MSKFKKDGRGAGPALNTASLPDIVFMLLFFFMVATTSKETDPAVKIAQPEGTRTVDLTAYKQRSEIDFLYLGQPRTHQEQMISNLASHYPSITWCKRLKMSFIQLTLFRAGSWTRRHKNPHV